jgi:hypothetical protein
MGWLLFFAVVLVIWWLVRSPKKPRPATPSVRVETLPNDDFDALPFGTEYQKYQWVPRYSVHTSLESLRHAGERWDGDPRKAPKYGEDGDGHWANVAFSNLDDVWSDIGTVPADGGDFKQFLMDFREIVESDAPTIERIKQCEELCERSSRYTEFADRIGDDFPYNWFASQLTVIPSVGQGTAQKLFDAGFIDLDRVRNARPEELEAVHGVGSGTVKEIRKFFELGAEGRPRRRFRDMASEDVPTEVRGPGHEEGPSRDDGR